MLQKVFQNLKESFVSIFKLLLDEILLALSDELCKDHLIDRLKLFFSGDILDRGRFSWGDMGFSKDFVKFLEQLVLIESLLEFFKCLDKVRISLTDHFSDFLAFLVG